MTNTNNQEIERKFLVVSDTFRALATKSVRISQGYLSTNEKSTIRVRRWDEQAFITIKSRGVEGSCAHFEWEKEIAPQDAEQLFRLISTGMIDKTRYLVPASDGHTWEVDVFHGEHEGLIIAEVELSAEDEAFVRPDFLGEEVTHDRRYYNSYLSTHPYQA